MAKNLKIEQVKIDDIKTYENNAKLHPAEQVEQIKASIKEFGFNDPIAIDENNMIIEGHGRYIALKELGYTDVPCIRLTHLNDKQKKAYIIAHNKINLNTGFDTDLLGDELKSILDDIDMTELGFGDFEISMLTEDMEPEGFDDEVINNYSKNADNFLVKKRVIITYEAGKQEEWLKKLLNKQGEELKVAYSVEELMETASEQH